jgi:hypothetical protein
MSETQANRRVRSKFPPFAGPNFTQVPDALFDLLLPELTGAELKVLLYIIRRTFGFKREADDISLSQMLNGIRRRDGSVLDRGVGLSKKSLLQALRDLEEMNLIIRERRSSEEAGNQPTNYRLNVAGQTLGVESTPPLGEKVHQGGGGEITPSPRGKNYTTQETVLQETELQKTVEQQTANSTSFDRFANLQQRRSSKFSKKRDAEIQKAGAQPSAEPAEVGRQASSFKPVGQLLSGRGVSRVAKTASVGPKNGSESAYYPSAGTESHPALETASKRPRGRPQKYPVPPGLELFTSDISAEFHDSSKLPSNLSFVGRVLQETGLHPDVLYQLMQEARQLTKARGNIEKPSADDPGFRNRWPYFRSTLLDLVEKEGRTVSARRQPQSGSP